MVVVRLLSFNKNDDDDDDDEDEDEDDNNNNNNKNWCCSRCWHAVGNTPTMLLLLVLFFEGFLFVAVAVVVASVV